MASRVVLLALLVVSAVCFLNIAAANDKHTDEARAKLESKDFEEPAGLHADEVGKAGVEGRALKAPFKESCTFRCGAAHGACKANGTLAACDYPKKCNCEKFFHDN
ncbi:hypothetical protein RvY_14903 [Ramazzottius varieornatus]|uniref:Invertebrate defensins family profile domain-containing protein n=1 Tax=Ramazzottius varieornatus TaxID=947166 RepID=A0A1D1VSX2_RAMVA|nr:hypothetical protein RvY_14903 [Ramazzottius varieornatus]